MPDVLNMWPHQKYNWFYDMKVKLSSYFDNCHDETAELTWVRLWKPVSCFVFNDPSEGGSVTGQPGMS